MAQLLHSDLTDKIIGAYYEVYNHTLRNYSEAIYERAMVVELARHGHQVTQQDGFRVLYRGRMIGIQQLDLLVLNTVLIENKVAEWLTPRHKAQGYSYLKTTGLQVALVLNFGSAKPEFARLYLDPDRVQMSPISIQTPPQAPNDWLYPELTYRIVGGLYAVHNELGVGYVHRIYANACYRELQLQGLAVKPRKRMDVAYKGTVVGNIAFAHLLVEEKVMVFPVAYWDRHVADLEVIREWMRACNIQLGILANFHEAQLATTFIRA